MCGSSPRILAAAWVDSSASRVCRARHHRTATSGEMNRYARRLHYPQLQLAAGDTHFYSRSAARMGAVITARTSRRPRASSPRLAIMLIIAHIKQQVSAINLSQGFQHRWSDFSTALTAPRSYVDSPCPLAQTPHLMHHPIPDTSSHNLDKSIHYSFLTRSG